METSTEKPAFRFVWREAEAPIMQNIIKSQINYIKKHTGRDGPDSEAVFRTYEILSRLGFIYGHYNIEGLSDLGEGKLGVGYRTRTKNFSLVLDVGEKSDPTVTSYKNRNRPSARI